MTLLTAAEQTCHRKMCYFQHIWIKDFFPCFVLYKCISIMYTDPHWHLKKQTQIWERFYNDFKFFKSLLLQNPDAHMNFSVLLQ